MKASIVEVRRRELATILEKNGSIVTDEIARQFGVTTETVRKDILALQERGLAIKCHGGAIAVDDVVTTMSTKEREVVNQEVKEKIAEKALSFLSDGMTVYLGPGSTVQYLARRLHEFSNLTIFTSSLSSTEELMSSPHPVYVLGGLVNDKNRSVCGSWGNDIIDKIAPSVAFMGCSGAEGFSGPTCGQFEEADTLRRVVRVSGKSVVLCDSSKFSWASLICYVQWREIDTLITDSKLPEENRQALEQYTNLLLV